MITNRGIATDNWTFVDGDCPIRSETVDERAQFELGVSTAAVHLVFTEPGLRRLLEQGTEMLRELEAH